MFQCRVMTIGSSFLCLLQGWPRAKRSDASPSSYSSSPDYKELSKLRLLYPNVPILALSATCPPDVLRDLISILRLAPPIDGRGTGSPPSIPGPRDYDCLLISHSAAPPYGTVKFTSPLYRKNLHYKVVSKPSSAKQVVKDMVKYILENHRDETGIIYCLSRAVSNEFPNSKHKHPSLMSNLSLYRTRSGSRLISILKARVKLRRVCTMRRSTIRRKRNCMTRGAWEKLKLYVPRLVRTIELVWSRVVLIDTLMTAFGLGIDKKDVRFVIHHSVSPLHPFHSRSYLKKALQGIGRLKFEYHLSVSSHLP